MIWYLTIVCYQWPLRNQNTCWSLTCPLQTLSCSADQAAALVCAGPLSWLLWTVLAPCPWRQLEPISDGRLTATTDIKVPPLCSRHHRRRVLHVDHHHGGHGQSVVRREGMAYSSHTCALTLASWRSASCPRSVQHWSCRPRSRTRRPRQHTWAVEREHVMTRWDSNGGAYLHEEAEQTSYHTQRVDMLSIGLGLHHIGLLEPLRPSSRAERRHVIIDTPT